LGRVVRLECVASCEQFAQQGSAISRAQRQRPLVRSPRSSLTAAPPCTPNRTRAQVMEIEGLFEAVARCVGMVRDLLQREPGGGNVSGRAGVGCCRVVPREREVQGRVQE